VEGISAGLHPADARRLLSAVSFNLSCPGPTSPSRSSLSSERRRQSPGRLPSRLFCIFQDLILLHRYLEGVCVGGSCDLWALTTRWE
jgi:hypothetical protein